VLNAAGNFVDDLSGALSLTAE
jgi:hypothetical protein